MKRKSEKSKIFPIRDNNDRKTEMIIKMKENRV